MAALLVNLVAILSLAGVLTGHDGAARHTPPAVTIHVAAGYSAQFRDTAWTPVRVTLRNRTSQSISGEVTVADTSNTNQGPPLPYHSQYEASVVLPAGATKRVTIYIPGYDIQGEVDARFSSPGLRSVTGSDYITSFGDEVMSVGTFSNDPSTTSWLNRVNQNTPLAVIHLNAATIDPVPDVLASFDAIILSNVDASQLDRDQLTALEQYVRDGGALILVGGPDWQETLRPLPAGLLPGHLAGTRTLGNLQGLRTLVPSAPVPTGRTAVSVLTQPHGTVLARQNGVPLVVRNPVGAGQIEYLAFDPELDPIARWSGGSDLLQHLITRAAPLAANRVAQPTNGPPIGPYGKFFGDPFGLSSELANLPSAALPSLILFVILTILFVLIIGPINFLFLRRLRRREFMWVTVPALALVCVVSTFAIAFHLKGSTVELNTVAAVSLDGAGPHPATFYVGLFAPVRGDYHLTYHGSALPSAIPQANYSPGPQRNPLGLRFDEGGRTGVTFVSMNMWSMRNIAIHTRVSLPGSIRPSLRLDAAGDIVGTIHNGFRFRLLHPIIIAGAKVVHLPTLPSGGTIHVRVRPDVNVYANNQNGRPFGMGFYGAPRFGFYGGYYSGPVGVPLMGGPGVFNGPCCPGPAPPAEKTILDRIRNVSAMLPDAQQLTSQNEVMLVGWTQHSIGSFDVDGTAPRQRELTMLSMPVTVSFPHGSFRLRSGTIGARLVDDVPQQTVSNVGCCGFGQPIYLGSGGSGIFEFDLPDRHARFSRLRLWANAGGATGDSIGRVYDWRAHRWVHVDLSSGEANLPHPNRFISPWGAVQVRLDATTASGDITISNLNRDLQLTGQAVQG